MCLKATSQPEPSVVLPNGIVASAAAAAAAAEVDYKEFSKKLGRKRPRQAVRFSTEEDETIYQQQRELHEEVDRDVDAGLLWYQRRELALFKLEVRDYVLGVTMNNQGIETRGLERYGLERVQNKRIALACTLLACEKGMTADEVAHVSRTCSSWSQDEAFKLACRDYCEVYHPNMVNLMTSTMSAAPLLNVNEDSVSASASKNQKRCVDMQEEDKDTRRVRIRTAY